MLTLIWKSALRNRTRTALTAFGVGIAIVGFLFLRTFVAAWTSGGAANASDRIITRNRISLTFTLPKAYAEKVRNVPGVAALSWATWFGGYYKDPKQFFGQIAVEADTYLQLYPEFLVSDAELKAFQQDRQGAIIGEQLAEKFGWKVGDRVTLTGTTYPGEWDFNIRGVYHGRDKDTDRQELLFQWRYLDEKAGATDPSVKDTFTWLVYRVNGNGGQVGRAVDQLFASSLAETRSQSEKAMRLSFLSMVSAVIKAIQLVSAVVLLILILILGNTLAMATRERTSEYAAMRAIGFRPRQVVGMVIAEGFVVAAVGVAVGCSLASPILEFFSEMFQKNMGPVLGAFELAPLDVALASAIALGGGMVAAAWPAWRAGRMRLVDALRRVE
jgi:putative ABC transport system permease protein